MSTERTSRTVNDALRDGQHRLAAAGIETPRLDAEVLLRHMLNLDRAQLFTRLNESIPEAAWEEYQRLIAERGAGTPVAYLTGTREFFGLSFLTTPGVLVPRPETELLVEWALSWLRRRTDATVVDVGTGTGAIALSLASALGSDWPGHIVACERSAEALAVAAANRARLERTGRVDLVLGNLLDWCAGPVDLIVANLPYLRPEQVVGNRALAAEPETALVGGPDGLDLIRRLIADSPRILAAGGAIILEIDPSQEDPVTELLAAAWPAASVSVLPDLAGLPRLAVAELRQSRTI